MHAMQWLGLVVGSAVVLGTFASVLGTLVVPRGQRARFAALVIGTCGGLLRLAANRFPEYRRRDRVLAMHGPLALLVLVVTWLGLLVVGFGLMLWPLAGRGLVGGLRLSGSSFFTLGFASSGRSGPTALAFLAAASGMVVVALQIAYLPTIYAAFNRRETLVTLLESRAGVPAWGPELLWRHQRVGLVDSLPQLYAQWEAWAADVAESHTTYPVLLYFRSPQPLRSWLTSLCAVLDAAALHLSLAPSRAPSEARLCLRMGFTALRDVAEVLNVPFDPDPDPDLPIALGFEEFVEAIGKLTEIGFPMERSAREAWPHFRGWRVNYEPIVHRVADLVVAPPAMWTGPRRFLTEAPMRPFRPVDRTPTSAAEERTPQDGD